MKYKKLSDLQKDIETLAGKWELSSEHEVSYREQGLDKEATVKGSLVAAEPDALVISVTTKEAVSDANPQRIGTASARTRSSRPIRRTVTGLVKLAGKWELDEKNRIAFSVKRGLARYDRLTFQGAWEINDNFQVTYTYVTDTKPQRLGTASSGAGRSCTSRLVFNGHWDISEKNRLTYLLGIDSDSAFRFRGTFETGSVLAKKGEIRYQVGIEYKTSRGVTKRLKRTITLFGKWKFSTDLALSLELECADGRRSEIGFGANLSLRQFQDCLPLLPDEVTVNLVSREDDPLGVELVLTKDFFDDAQAFVRLRESLKETAVEAGVKIPW